MTNYKDAKYQFPASATTSGTLADARISASSVTQHASDYIAWQSVVTASTLTAVAGRGYPINTTSNACTVTLPASASVGDTIKFIDYARNWNVNAVTLNQNSLKFQGNTAPNPVYSTIGQAITITYVDVTKGWIPTVDDDVLDKTGTYDIEWLVIGGGGSGGTGYRSGGGGAGGYRNSYASETSGGGGSTETPYQTLVIGGGIVITATVGAGADNPATSGLKGTNGGSSSISGTGLTTITSYGGGGGGYHATGNENQAGTWGSSGGQGHYDSVEGVTTGGTANQGYAGGGIVGLNPYYVSGGGGGAGSVGSGGGSVDSNSGNGGLALTSSITGSAVARAGGGGAGGYYSSTTHADGGTGGGGGAGNGGTDHAAPATNGASATAASDGHNSGSGGGGSGGLQTSGTGDGHAGIVILRMPTSGYSGTTSGSPTVITDGVDTVLVFNASGSYTT